MNQKFIVFTIYLLAMTFTVFSSTEKNVFGWHGELGISGERAAELWQSNPDDPAITEWRLQLQDHKVKTISGCNYQLSSPPAGKDGKITDEQWEAHDSLVQSGKDSCVYMMNILVQQCVSHAAMQPIACADSRVEDQLVKRCATHAITDPIVCENPRLKEKVKEEILRYERELQYQKEQKLVEYCAIHPINQSKSCEDPKLKLSISDYKEVLKSEKERKEAQKGTILEKLNEQPYSREPYTTTDKDKKGFIDRDDDDDDEEKDNDDDDGKKDKKRKD